MSSCLIFGGSKGIGLAISKTLLENGSRVVIASNNPENIKDCMTKLNEKPDCVLGITCNVTSEDDVNKTVQQAQQWMGRIDVLVNAAGINRDSLLLKSKLSDITQQLNTNLVGTILTCKAAVRVMLKNKKGCIINIGSIVGSKGNVGQSVYSASKAGVEGFTKSLAKEVASRGITANVIAPGYIRTDMTAERNIPLQKILMQRMGEPEEVADLVKFLTNASYITGQVIHIDGGYNINS